MKHKKRNAQARSSLARGSASGKPKLFEITAMVTYSVVVLAASESDAKEHIATWEQCWPTSSDLVGVSDVDTLDIRPLKARNWKDEAHEATPAALSLLNSEVCHGAPEPKLKT